MNPDMCTTFTKAEVDAAAREHTEAGHAKWQADWRLFKGNLTLDQKVTKMFEFGSRALHDVLEWHGGMYVQQQRVNGKSLVNQCMDHFMPKATASSWIAVPGALVFAVQPVHNLDGCSLKGPPHIVAIPEFKTPNTRDAWGMNRHGCCL